MQNDFKEARILATLVLSCFPCFRFFDTVLYQMVIVGNELFELFFYKKKMKIV